MFQKIPLYVGIRDGVKIGAHFGRAGPTCPNHGFRSYSCMKFDVQAVDEELCIKLCHTYLRVKVVVPPTPHTLPA